MAAGASVNIKLAYVMFWEMRGRRGGGTKHHHYHQISLSLSLSPEKMFNYPLGWNICHEAAAPERPGLVVLILQPSGQAVSVLSDGLSWVSLIENG